MKHPLDEKAAYKQNTTVLWAIDQLNILADIADAGGLKWFAAKISDVSRKLKGLESYD